MRHEVAERWRERVRRHVLETQGEDRGHLLAFDFPSGQGVRAVFPDGSRVEFRYAFFLMDDALREAAVFTEHCGYHYFPLGELKIEHFRESYADPDAGPGGDVHALLAGVTDRASFLRFVRALAVSHGAHGGVAWASERAGDFLEAAAAWAHDAAPDGGLSEAPSWHALAEFLYAGAIYE